MTPTILPPFVISRRFDVPRDEMWAIWTTPERLSGFFGPKGFDCEVTELDLRPGGTCRYTLRSPDGVEMRGMWTYTEVDAPRRFGSIVSFCDAEGRIVRHPFAEEWPLKTRGTMSFEEADGGTRIAVEWLPDEATPAEIACFDAARDDMAQGWGGTFENLERYLETN